MQKLAKPRPTAEMFFLRKGDRDNTYGDGFNR